MPHWPAWERERSNRFPGKDVMLILFIDSLVDIAGHPKQGGQASWDANFVVLDQSWEMGD